MNQLKILIVNQEPSALALLSSMLRSLGHLIDEAANDRVAVRQLERGGISLVLAGVDPGDKDSLELLTYARRKHRQVPVILLFPEPNLERQKEAMRLGALAVLRYPVPALELRAAVMQGLDGCQRANAESQPPNGQNGHGQTVSAPPAAMPPAQPVTRPDPFARELGIVGADPCLKMALETAAMIAPTRTPVLIVGERGTGKALLARAIHALGSKSDQPYVTIDCAALTEATHERERGVEPADPDNAHRLNPSTYWPAKLLQAQGGTLFLNDVSAFSDSLQQLLLRALQERVQEGRAERAPQADIRFLMSACDNLAALVDQARFRQDLYHRASVVCLKLPPLRHRGEDVVHLAEHVRSRYSLEFGKNVIGFTRDALESLARHDWPGNIRELEGVIRRAVSLCQGTRITAGHLAPSICPPRSSRAAAIAFHARSPVQIRPLKEALEEPEKRIIIQALQALNWNRQETAKVLDINRTTLYKKMKKYGLLVDEPAWVN